MPRRRRRRFEFIAYRIVCSVDGRRYIGITTQPLGSRWSRHKFQARRAMDPRPLYQAMREHGIEAFSIEHVASALSWQSLLETEAALVRQWDSRLEGHGYNLSDGGSRGPTGRTLSDEEREMRSEIGRRAWSDPEAKARRVAAMRVPEVRAKMKATRLARLAGKCRKGHSTADAYQFPSIQGRKRCRQCAAERDAKQYGKLPKIPAPRDGVTYQGVAYKNLRECALATGHAPSWATVNYRKGVIKAA